MLDSKHRIQFQPSCTLNADLRSKNLSHNLPALTLSLSHNLPALNLSLSLSHLVQTLSLSPNHLVQTLSLSHSHLVQCPSHRSQPVPLISQLSLLAILIISKSYKTLT